MRFSKYFGFLSSLTLLWACTTEVTQNQSPSRIEALDSIQIDTLHTKKLVRVYLPSGYDESSNTYSVIYLQDGQNLFYDSTSYVGEWGVDEALDSLDQALGLKVIAVGIDHGNEKRISEYSMYDSEYGRASGQSYLYFLKSQLKPLIDKKYRTKSDPAHTMILGSSLGGLICHYAFFESPEIFGRVGIFSPSYWFDTLSLELAAKPLPDYTRLYFYGGGKEGSNMVGYLNQMGEHLEKAGIDSSHFKISVDSLGEHREYFWKKEFPKAVVWLLD